jgi:N-acetylmuramoyl-L-alanine amidase
MDAPRPDSPLVEAWLPSPNHGERRGGREPDFIVLHYTGMPTEAGALDRLCDPAAEVSCHYVVRDSGAILQMVPESRRAWHAGASCWRGERDMNSASIGVEIVNPGHVNGAATPFTEAQVVAVAALLRDILARRRIAPDRVLAHSDIAPGRKIDPGEAFPWERLRDLGVDVPIPVALVDGDGPTLREGDAGEAVAALQRQLARQGYDLDADGVFGPRTRAVVEAFQRRYRRSRIDGIADPETLGLLAVLLGGEA